jgi:hypothetical protein
MVHLHSAKLMATKRRRSPITQKGYRKGEPPPNKGLKLPPEVLTPDELERLMATFDRRSKRGIRNAAMAALMARAGLKVGQVLAMQRRHYEPGSNVVTIPAGSGKTSREHTVPIDAVTREHLEAWWEVRKSLGTSRIAPLFGGVNEGSVGNPVHSAYVRQMLRTAADRADIDKRVGPSSLKATYEARTAERSSRIVAQLAAYIDEATFGSRHPIAHQKWRTAFDLFELDPALHATRIGHDVREALLEFANDLVREHAVSVDMGAGTKTKIRAVFDAQEGMSRDKRLLADKLIDFWHAVSNLAQRQEHAASREASPLTEDDARRVIFQTLNVMVELDSALTGSR